MNPSDDEIIIQPPRRAVIAGSTNWRRVMHRLNAPPNQTTAQDARRRRQIEAGTLQITAPVSRIPAGNGLFKKRGSKKVR